MPIGTILSALILAIQMLSGGSFAVLWLAAVSRINGARTVLASPSQTFPTVG